MNDAQALRTSRHLLSTRVEIGTARSVKQGLATAGSQHVAKSCSRRATSMLSSPCLASWHHWPCRIRRSSTISCSAPVRKPFSKSLAIPNISAHRSASSAYCTLGIKSSNFTRMSIAWSLPADSHKTGPIRSRTAGTLLSTTVFQTALVPLVATCLRSQTSGCFFMCYNRAHAQIWPGPHTWLRSVTIASRRQSSSGSIAIMSFSTIPIRWS